MLTWAEELGLSEAAALLEETLEEEKATDVALTALAESAVNMAAEGDSAESDEDEEEVVATKSTRKTASARK